jgi:hypothetical protein
MAERILPTPDAFATCPTDGKILEYYADTFESVFVVLHPFIKTVSIGIEQFKPAVCSQNRIRSTMELCGTGGRPRVRRVSRFPSEHITVSRARVHGKCEEIVCQEDLQDIFLA